MELNATKYPNLSRVITGASVLFPNDSILLCNTSSAPVSMTLLEIPAGYWQQTWKLYVLDNSNNAGTFSITINAPSGTTINGSTSLVINVNGGGCVVTITSDTTFNGQLNYSTGGGGSALTIANASTDITTNTTKVTFANATVIPTTPSQASVTFLGGISSITADAPLTGGLITGIGSIGINAANLSTDGYLTSTDYIDFDTKSEKIATEITGTIPPVVAYTTTFKFDSTYYDVTAATLTEALIKDVVLGAIFAQSAPPANVLSIPAAFATTLFNSGDLQIMGEVYDDTSSYDPLTGIWTCPVSGRYDLSFYGHYTALSSFTVGWNVGANPLFSVGITSPTGNTLYCGNSMTITMTQKHVDICASAFGLQISSGTQLCLKVLNQTGFNYVSVTGDIVRMVIQRIR